MSTAVTTQTFEEEVLQSEKPVIVDFWAEWCGPCHAVSPVLDKIAEERADELKLVKINVDEEQELMIRYGVQSIPTIVLFKDGGPAAAVIGAQPKGAIERGLGLVEAADLSVCPPARATSGPARSRSRSSGGQLGLAEQPSHMSSVTSSAAHRRAADDPRQPDEISTVRVPGPSPYGNEEGTEPLVRLDLQAGLLEQLAPEGVERVLVLPEEAAGEIPHAGVRLPAPAGEQDAAVVVHAEGARGRRGVRVGDIAARRALGATVVRLDPGAAARAVPPVVEEPHRQAVCASMPIREHEFSRVGLLAEFRDRPPQALRADAPRFDRRRRGGRPRG